MQTRAPRNSYWLLFVAGVFAVALWTINLGIGSSALTNAPKWTEAITKISSLGDKIGLLGDSFGMVNALFSSIAVSGAIYAVILQQRQYRDSIEDAKASEVLQQQIAEVHAVSAYAQCVASLLSDIQNRSEIGLERFNSTGTAIESIVLQGSALSQDDLQRLEVLRTRHAAEAKSATSLTEISADLASQLAGAMHVLKTLPLAASKISEFTKNDSETSGDR